MEGRRQARRCAPPSRRRPNPDLYDLAVTFARWQIVLLKIRTARDASLSDEEFARLGRYERRARSARNRAIRLFTATLVCRSSLGHAPNNKVAKFGDRPASEIAAAPARAVA